MTLTDRIGRLDSHHRLLIALGVALAVLGLLPGQMIGPTRMVATWVAFVLTVLLLAWTSMLTVHPRELPRLSRLQDSSRLLILAFVVLGALASLLVVVGLLREMRGETTWNLIGHIALSVVAVVGSWGLVHTLFTLRYAHLFYADATLGGLAFPGESEPDYLDFAYFSFIIGMTSQVSDVSISDRAIRRLALLHGLISFAFNAVIIALTLNAVAGLLGH